jgi:glutamine amidotransferase
VKISIVDYGAGNLPSVERAFARAGAETERATQAAQLREARAIVLPGVGHFAAFVGGLRERGLQDELLRAVERGTPLFGICLGLQALFRGSEEAAGDAGLGLFQGEVRALPRDVKSPHIGWNQVRRVGESRLLRGVADDAYFYFAHSYAAPERAAKGATAAVCDHGFAFTAVLERGPLMGVQFHPEKSGAAGAQVVANFLEAAR